MGEPPPPAPLPGGLERNYRIRPNEADPFNELKATALLDLLQDIAWEHASQLGLSVTQLMERGQTWVLSRFHLSVFHPILQGQRIRIRTWPVGVYRLFAIRDFDIWSESGQCLGAATSGWLVLTWPELRPCRPDGLMDTVATHGERSIEDPFDTLPRVRHPAASVALTVRWNEIDINNHVNNTVYPLWAFESLPESFHRGWRCREVEIQFTGMALPGDSVCVLRDAEPRDPETHCLHQVNQADSGKELARIRTGWSPRTPGENHSG